METTLANMIEEIMELKKSKDFAILAHNYQPPELQDIADYVGDSLQLATLATQLEKSRILFLGVDFMAETIKLLNLDKTVIVPDPEATCPLANSLTPEIVERYRNEFPGVPIVLYINSTLECKAFADVICTSANAVEIVARLNCQRVIFGPDKNLASYVAEKTGKDIIPIPGETGYCYVHENFKVSSLLDARRSYPEAKIMVHPEVPKELRRLADYVGSTGQMLRYPAATDAREFVVGTEIGMLHRLRKTFPDRIFYPLDHAVCFNMKLNTLEKVYRSLNEEVHEVTIDEGVAREAFKSVRKMFELMEK